MTHTIYLELCPRGEDDPLGQHAIRALIAFESESPPVVQSSFRLNLYLKENYIGSVNIVYSVTTYYDQLVGVYFSGAAMFEDPDLLQDLDVDDAVLRECILTAFRECHLFEIYEDPLEFDVRERLLRKAGAAIASKKSRRH